MAVLPALFRGIDFLSGRRILLVGRDDALMLELAHKIGKQGMLSFSARNGQSALETIESNHPELVLILTDLCDFPAIDFCSEIKSRGDQEMTQIMLRCDSNDDALLRQARLHGVDEFIRPDETASSIVLRCHSLLRIRTLLEEVDSAEEILYAFARAVDAKSPFTLNHSQCVAKYAVALSKQIALTEEDVELVRRGSLLHDIGKIGVPDHILDKPGKLTDEEYDIIKKHPEMGVKIVEPLRSARELIPMIRWHHERMDGKGYPDGIPAAELPQFVRVVSVADIFDALTNDRPYRAGMPNEKALAIINEMAQTGGLDPDLVRAFVEIAPVLRCQCKDSPMATGAWLMQ